MQQLTCKMVGLFLFILFFKSLNFKRSPGGKFLKKVWKVWKSAKKCEKSAETILPFSCCPSIFLWVKLVFHHFPIYRRDGWSQSFPLKIFFSCSLGGRSFSAPCRWQFGSWGVITRAVFSLWNLSTKVKRGREKGDGRNSVINCRKTVVNCRDAL